MIWIKLKKYGKMFFAEQKCLDRRAACVDQLAGNNTSTVRLREVFCRVHWWAGVVSPLGIKAPRDRSTHIGCNQIKLFDPTSDF